MYLIRWSSGTSICYGPRIVELGTTWRKLTIQDKSFTIVTQQNPNVSVPNVSITINSWQLYLSPHWTWLLQMSSVMFEGWAKYDLELNRKLRSLSAEWTYWLMRVWVLYVYMCMRLVQYNRSEWFYRVATEKLKGLKELVFVSRKMVVIWCRSSHIILKEIH